MKLSQLAGILKGELKGADIEYTGVSTDTRTIVPNALFVAIKGPHFDAHEFAAVAKEKDAAAILVQKPISVDMPYVLVSDTVKALGQLAAFHRQQFNIPIIAITGSCGKTTVKTMTSNILTYCGSVLFPESSFNNEIGLPLTVLKLTSAHQYAVLEMGTNHFGEIAYLTHIARPTVATITNAGPAHLEGLGDVQGVSRAKGEIFQGLTTDGIGIINADDTYAKYWESLVHQHTQQSNDQSSILYFGLENKADVTAKNIRLNNLAKACFTLLTPLGETDIQLPLLGRHNVMNALTAAACAIAVGAPLSAIKQGLETVIPVKRRLNEYQSYNGAQVIDDSYNANPLSFKAAIETLAGRQGEKVVVLGDMKELGPQANAYHRELGLTAQRLGINKLLAYGEFAQAAAEGFGPNAEYFSDQNLLIEALKSILHPQMTVLIKGSLSTGMDRVVKAIL